jgi:hypothetical protein
MHTDMKAAQMGTEVCFIIGEISGWSLNKHVFVHVVQIVPASYCAAAYLESIDFPKDKKIFLVSSGGVQEELREAVSLKAVTYLLLTQKDSHISIRARECAPRADDTQSLTANPSPPIRAFLMLAERPTLRRL